MLGYRLQVPVPGNRRRKIDIAFVGAQVAVFVDGCFWHGCPVHGTRPRANADWWRWKIERNQTRDRDTDGLLSEAGWEVIRVWEHEDPGLAARRVADIVWRRRAGRSSVGASG